MIRRNWKSEFAEVNLLHLDQDFRNYWPLRNKGTIEKCAPFLRWRMEDYRRGVLHFAPEVACEKAGKRA